MCRKSKLKVIWILWITMGLNAALQYQGSILEFPYKSLMIADNQNFIDIPIIRNDNGLDTYLTVACTVKSTSANAAQELKESTVQTTVTFLPGERSKSCRVSLIDDVLLRSSELILVTLNHAESSGSAIPVIGTNNSVLITITKDEDIPTIQFKDDSHTVQEPNLSDHATKVLVTVVRRGDTKNSSSVRVSTRDGLAAAGIDFHPISMRLTFEPGDSTHKFTVDILHNSENKWHRTFAVELSESVNAKLGEIRSLTIIIVDGGANRRTILPTPPVVMSLPFYGKIGAATSAEPLPGYPLICVSPCDPNFPRYSDTKERCYESSTNATRYLWEIATLPLTNNVQPVFKPLMASTVFARVDGMVLDSIFFREGLLVRCAILVTDKDTIGVPIKSDFVTIGEKNVCRTPTLHGLPTELQFQPFIATLKYVNVEDKTHPNRLHVHVEIPHNDGMLPLISTQPIYNLNLLLTDPIYRKQHVCSNLIMPNEPGILEGGFLNSLTQFENASRPIVFDHQFDDKLRGNQTVLMYRHLDLKKCIWTFDSWYHMTELVDLCGGYVLTDLQIESSSRHYITVRVPLYVSYVMAVPPSSWSSMEHHTEMDFSFSYSSLLWKTGLEIDQALEGQLQINRISLGGNGQLIINFQTKAIFRGLFVIEHHTMLNERSQLISPSHLKLGFTLQLLWTAETFDSPTQTWRAVSNYSLKDYSGKYILQLVPCTVSPIQKYMPIMSPQQTLPCTAHTAKQFVIPIAFQQTSRPVPVTYSLHTEFQLLNNENIFLADPLNPEFQLSNADYNVIFSKGQKVYGRVLWHPRQDLTSAYQIIIEKVFLCTGLDGFVPAYDPSGEDYGEGPQFGCIQPNKKLKHRFVILDRSNYHNEKQLNDNIIDLKARFAKDNLSYSVLQSMNGMDGFVFDVDELYKVDAGHQWFVQVLYTIGLVEMNKRFKRTIVGDFPVPQNGTNMKTLQLTEPESHAQAKTSVATIVSVVIVFSFALILVGVLIAYYNLRNSCSPFNCSAQHLNCSSIQNYVEDKMITTNQYCTVKFKKIPKELSNIENTDLTEV